MHTGSFKYTVDTEVRLSVSEVQALKTCADNHYDHKVKESGRDGAIARVAKYAAMNALADAEGEPLDLDATLSTDDLDLMMKALEQAPYHNEPTAMIGAALKAELLAAFRAATAEWCRLAGVEYTP